MPSTFRDAAVELWAAYRNEREANRQREQAKTRLETAAAEFRRLSPYPMDHFSYSANEAAHMISVVLEAQS